MSDESALASLRFHWGEAYKIWRDWRGHWYAMEHAFAPAKILHAGTADELRALIRADYRRLERVPGTEHVGGEAREPDGDDADDDG